MPTARGHKRTHMTCRICQAPLAGHLWAYCSEACRKKGREDQYAQYRDVRKKPDERDRADRVCLGPFCRGKQTFLSDGKGNRVCKRCKTNAYVERWKGGGYVDRAAPADERASLALSPDAIPEMESTQ